MLGMNFCPPNPGSTWFKLNIKKIKWFLIAVVINGANRHDQNHVDQGNKLSNSVLISPFKKDYVTNWSEDDRTVPGLMATPTFMLVLRMSAHRAGISPRATASIWKVYWLPPASAMSETHLKPTNWGFGEITGMTALLSRIGNHHMTIEESITMLSQALDDRRAPCDIGDKVTCLRNHDVLFGDKLPIRTIHYIKVKIVCTSIQNTLGLFFQCWKIRSKHRGTNFELTVASHDKQEASSTTASSRLLRCESFDGYPTMPKLFIHERQK